MYEILQTLNTLPAYPTCSELEQVADTVGENILERFRQEEAIYDQTTDSSRNQLTPLTRHPAQ